jgi:hypothetical protein
MLFRDFTEFYRAFASGETPALPELPIQYSDFAQWQRQWLQGEALESRVTYWKQQLAGVPLLELPSDRPRPPVQTYNGGHQPVVVSRHLTEALRDLGRREGATLYMVVMAAFNLLLYRYSGQEDITIGSSAAGRSRLETENLIGFFINNLVVRTDLSDRNSFGISAIESETPGAIGGGGSGLRPYTTIVATVEELLMLEQLLEGT